MPMINENKLTTYQEQNYWSVWAHGIKHIKSHSKQASLENQLFLNPFPLSLFVTNILTPFPLLVIEQKVAKHFQINIRENVLWVQYRTCLLHNTSYPTFTFPLSNI